MKQDLRTVVAARPRHRQVVGYVSAVILLWSLLPLVNFVFGVGVLAPAGTALLGLWWGFSANVSQNKPKGWRKALVTVVITGICLVSALAILIISLMVTAAVKKPPENATVVVLGALVIKDKPSRMLRQRLDVAAAYLEEHPDANCVVSGGQGPNEDYTEAYVMQKYLVEKKGIDPARIALEERSTDTHQNIDYSLECIRQRGWSTDLAIATQEFHQYRAASLSRRAGVERVGAITCGSPAHLLLCYWVRECAAICRLWILKY